MTETENRLNRCFEEIRGRIPCTPEVALVLGSGLGSFAEDHMETDAVIPFGGIGSFPTSTVEGHRGRFVFGRVGEIRVVAMQGRVHYYEGYSMEDVVLPIRLMRRMGAERLILTNAAGGLNTDFEPGSLMMITDQIASFVPSPLIGPNPDSLGVRFPDMSSVYDETYMEILRRTAKEKGIPLREGVYIQLTGPNYETPAEVRMCRALGADAVGMSTACEAVAARHCGFRILGVSCITNLASGLSGKPLSHEEVQLGADAASARFAELIGSAIRNIAGK
ncbi:MAG: purine-nucleoside phosphorylase [Lachnospiraceae bacterium]|jgi:purine-nucleoside phosphorylase|nr:purine-nucleoside phosphorylase [Lachnospiraceae bacterium]